MIRGIAWSPALLLLSAMLIHASVPSLLPYDRIAILENGQVWRMLTGHWVHAGWLHGAINISALLLLERLDHPPQKARALLIDMLMMALATSVLLLVFVPDLVQYTGFSGVLHGLWAQSGIRRLKTPQRWQGIIMLTALMAKLLVEYGGNTSGNWSDIPVIPESHLLGAIAGLMIAVVKQQKSRRMP